MEIDIKEHLKDLYENFDNHLDNDNFNDNIDKEKLKQIKVILNKAPSEIINELFLGQRRIFHPEDVNPDHCTYHEVDKQHIINYKFRCLQAKRIQQIKKQDTGKEKNTSKKENP